jgi:hypothetical protein
MRGPSLAGLRFGSTREKADRDRPFPVAWFYSDNAYSDYTYSTGTKSLRRGSRLGLLLAAGWRRCGARCGCRRRRFFCGCRLGALRRRLVAALAACGDAEQSDSGNGRENNLPHYISPSQPVPGEPGKSSQERARRETVASLTLTPGNISSEQLLPGRSEGKIMTFASSIDVTATSLQ